MLADMDEFLSEKKTYILKKEILYVREHVTVGEILQIEYKFIRSLDARNPSIGYNR